MNKELIKSYAHDFGEELLAGQKEDLKSRLEELENRVKALEMAFLYKEYPYKSIIKNID